MPKVAPNMKLNSVYEMPTVDGDKIKLTLTYRWLYALKTKYKDTYEDYNRIMTKGFTDEFDNITVLYTAYLCEYISEHGNTDNAMSYDDFLDVLPFDRQEIARAVGMLISPKKAMASKELF